MILVLFLAQQKGKQISVVTLSLITPRLFHCPWTRLLYNYAPLSLSTLVPCQRSTTNDQALGISCHGDASATCHCDVIHAKSMGEYHGVVFPDHWSTAGNYDVLPRLLGAEQKIQFLKFLPRISGHSHAYRIQG